MMPVVVVMMAVANTCRTLSAFHVSDKEPCPGKAGDVWRPFIAILLMKATSSMNAGESRYFSVS